MNAQQLKQLKDLIFLAQKAFTDLKLQDAPALTASDIKKFKDDDSIFNFEKNFDRKNKTTYKIQAKKILDYLLFSAIAELLTIMEQTNISEWDILWKALNFLRDSGINILGKFLGPHNVPEFVDDERLFKKMLWIEWLCAQLLNYIKKDIIIDFSVPIFGGPKAEVLTRLKGTAQFINSYIEKHPKLTADVLAFRKSYENYDINQSYNTAILALNKPLPALPKPKVPPKPIIPPQTILTMQKIEIRERQPTVSALPPHVLEEKYPQKPKLREKSIETPVTPLNNTMVLSTEDLINLELQKTRGLLQLQNEPLDQHKFKILCELTLNYQGYLKNIIWINGYSEDSEDYRKIDKKIKCTNDLLSTKNLNDFQKTFLGTKNTITQDRDSVGMKFVKAILSLFVVPLFFGLWKVKGKKVVNDINKTLSMPTP